MGKIAAVVLLAFGTAGGQSLPLVEQGRSRYTICISSDASPSERRGARELQRFLEEMSGARLPIVTDAENPRGPLVLVGRSKALDGLGGRLPFEKLGPEGFTLKTAGPHLVVAGGRQRGTMYGVYTFLEKLGCRWYTREVSVIPKKRTVRVPAMDETGKPAFEYREIYITEAEGKEWGARNKLNGHFSELDESTGGKVQYYPWCHSFYDLIPPAKHFLEHPEYFALVNGERRAERAQLCLSNPEVLRLGIETVLRWIREHPEATIISVSQNDTESWCECGNCRRIEQEEGGSHSGPILRLVNAIAAEIENKHPDKLIDTLAYTFSERPPLKARPRRNVRIRLAPIGVCQGHPYEECQRNAYFVNNLREWSKITNQLYVWHYVVGFWQYLLPYPNFDELAADLPMYHRRGVVGLFLQGANSRGGGAEFAELRSYLLAKLLWNPYADSAAIMNEFLGAYYGPAASKIREYIEVMQREVRRPPGGLGKPMWVYRSPRFSPDFLRAAREVLAKALSAAPDEAIAQRVRKVRLSIEWADLLEAKRFVLEDGRYGPQDPEAFWRRFRDFMRAARGFGITNLHEWYEIGETEREYAQYVKTYPATTLENEWLRVVVVPGLHGRIVRMVNKKTGRDGVRHADPDERFSNVEAQGGLVLLAHTDYYSRERYDPEWRIASYGEGREVVLAGASSNGLRLSRVLRLAPGEPVLHTVTTVRSEATQPVTVVLQSRAEFNPGDPDAPRVEFGYRKPDGREITEQLLPARADFFGERAFLGPDRPAGEWRLVNRSLGVVLRNRFSLAQTARCRLWWRGRGENKVNLSVWSEKKTLKPGESLALEADYAVE